MPPNIPEFLYHTTLIVTDFHADTSGSTQTAYVLGTHSDLDAAKAFTVTALQSLHYEPGDFATYEVHKPQQPWTHGDGVLVFAKAFAGQEFLVGLDTKPNSEGLPAGPDGGVVLPRGEDHLHYVLQTKVDYHQDRSGAYQTTEIEGCYAKRADAVASAAKCLEDDKANFAQYDERRSLDTAEDWPFGEDVLVHAVAQTGENYTIAVRTVPGAHKRHAKKVQAVKTH